jgi:hypothetical protein
MCSTRPAWRLPAVAALMSCFWLPLVECAVGDLVTVWSAVNQQCLDASGDGWWYCSTVQFPTMENNGYEARIQTHGPDNGSVVVRTSSTVQYTSANAYILDLQLTPSSQIAALLVPGGGISSETRSYAFRFASVSASTSIVVASRFQLCGDGVVRGGGTDYAQPAVHPTCSGLTLAVAPVAGLIPNQAGGGPAGVATANSQPGSNSIVHNNGNTNTDPNAGDAEAEVEGDFLDVVDEDTGEVLTAEQQQQQEEEAEAD